MIVASGFCPTAMQVAVETVTGPGFKSRPRPLSFIFAIFRMFHGFFVFREFWFGVMRYE